MADITSNYSRLNTTIYFADGDYRTIQMKNPRSNVTKAEVAEIDWSVLIGDKTGAPFNYLGKVFRIRGTETTWDLNN